MSNESLRQELNSHYVNVFIPNIIWSMLCLVVGVAGNVCVILVYVFKMKNDKKQNKNKEQRYFIPFLAAFDMGATIFGITYGMLDYTHYVDFESEEFCKMTVFLSYTWTAISAHTLLIIAIQRYKMICKPHGPQMNLFWMRGAILISTGTSVVISLPVLHSSGIRQFEWPFKGTNVTISTCALSVNSDQLFDKIYLSLSASLVAANILAIIGVYVPVARVILRTFKSKRRERASSKIITAETNLESDKVNNDKRDIRKTNSDEEKLANTQKKSDNRKRKAKVNFNMMFLTVIIFYLLSCIPAIVMMVVKNDDVAYWHSLSDVQVRTQLCFVRFYVINSIVNPFIYGYFDFDFRHSVKALFKCV